MFLNVLSQQPCRPEFLSSPVLSVSGMPKQLPKRALRASSPCDGRVLASRPTLESHPDPEPCLCIVRYAVGSCPDLLRSPTPFLPRDSAAESRLAVPGPQVRFSIARVQGVSPSPCRSTLAGPGD